DRVPALLEFLAHPMFGADRPAKGYSASDIVAFARSKEARWFAILVSPDLAYKFKTWIDGQSSTAFGSRSREMMRRANALLEGTPEAGRPALIKHWEGLDEKSLRAELIVKDPVEPLFPKFDPETFGVDQ